MTRTEAWLELDRQEALTIALGQTTCGLTTHREPSCDGAGQRYEDVHRCGASNSRRNAGIT
jgi:hypothetical protein